MNRFDFSTMPLDQAINWDPSSIAAQAIITEDWIGTASSEKAAVLQWLMSNSNSNTFLSKLLDYNCFMAIVIRGQEYFYHPIMLRDFDRFTVGPVIYGPYLLPSRDVTTEETISSIVSKFPLK